MEAPCPRRSGTIRRTGLIGLSLGGNIAREELTRLPDCPAAKALAALTTYVVDRTG